MESFSVKLADIKQTQFVVTMYLNSKRSPSRDCYIHMKDGSRIELDMQRSGINPVKVFKALESKSIPFVKQTERVNNPVKISVSS